MKDQNKEERSTLEERRTPKEKSKDSKERNLIVKKERLEKLLLSLLLLSTCFSETAVLFCIEPRTELN
jgi:hypothetical protein